jgi:hypothetical protein
MGIANTLRQLVSHALKFAKEKAASQSGFFCGCLNPRACCSLERVNPQPAQPHGHPHALAHGGGANAAGAHVPDGRSTPAQAAHKPAQGGSKWGPAARKQAQAAHKRARGGSTRALVAHKRAQAARKLVLAGSTPALGQTGSRSTTHCPRWQKSSHRRRQALPGKQRFLRLVSSLFSCEGAALTALNAFWLAGKHLQSVSLCIAP